MDRATGPALAELLERTRLLARGLVEITLPERTFGILHRPLSAVELAWRLHTETLQSAAQLIKLPAELALALAERIR